MTPITTPINIEHVATTKLVPYANNSRRHGAEQVAQLAAAIREFGFTNPVLVDDENGIIAGHGRVLAAQQLGMAKVPCIRLRHLTEAQRRAYVIADNRLAELSEWDHAMLAAEVEAIELDGDTDLSLLGFADADMAALLADADLIDAPKPAKAPKPHKAAPQHDDTEQSDDDEAAPTADDYADVGEGLTNANEGKAILYPLLAQLTKAQHTHWKPWRRKHASVEDALMALLDVADEAASRETSDAAAGEGGEA